MSLTSGVTDRCLGSGKVWRGFRVELRVSAGDEGQHGDIGVQLSEEDRKEGNTARLGVSATCGPVGRHFAVPQLFPPSSRWS